MKLAEENADQLTKIDSTFGTSLKPVACLILAFIQIFLYFLIMKARKIANNDFYFIAIVYALMSITAITSSYYIIKHDNKYRYCIFELIAIYAFFFIMACVNTNSVMFMLTNSFYEESIFRFSVYNCLVITFLGEKKRLFTPYLLISLIVQSIFAYLHYMDFGILTHAKYYIACILFSMILQLCMNYTKSIIITGTLHALYNLCIIAASSV